MRATLVEKELGPPAQSEAERLTPSDFGLLYETHRLSVYRYLRARPHRDHDPPAALARPPRGRHARGLAPETFVRASTGLSRFRRRDGGVQAWLLRIARNSAIDAHRPHRPTIAPAGGHS